MSDEDGNIVFNPLTLSMQLMGIANDIVIDGRNIQPNDCLIFLI